MVPRRMLGDAEVVEIRDEDGRIVIELIREGEKEDQDPISGLGQDPVPCGSADASINHDQHLYSIGRAREGCKDPGFSR